ncbi:MAG: alcohol dehydrogenase [Sphingomonas sp.]|nr:MAG: alcohol dehydrogenase [Sphingomonas sp.]
MLFVLSLAIPALLPSGGAPVLAGPAAAKPDPALVEKGSYVARLGDCMACHTAVGGATYAGGLKIKTPVGAIYSTNITPTATGIGDYSLADFDAAVRRGIRKDGSSLYPAMPYSAFSRMSDEDIKALYAYFMYGVEPVAQANKAVDIRWPFSMRWPLALWRKWFALEDGPFAAAPGQDPVVARGEYLVTGAGHCGACHTPRGWSMQEKAFDAKGGEVYLSGGAPIDNWVAPSLRNDPTVGLGNWSEEDIVQFLKSGRTDHAAVFGGMSDVVGWSTQHFKDEDLVAMARYLKSLPPVTAKGHYAYDPATAQMLAAGAVGSNAGAGIYLKECAICHSNDGSGVARMFPPLAGNPVIVTENPTSIVNVVVNGGVLPPTNWAPSAVAMPGFKDRLTDKQIADVVNFLRISWGNKAPANVTAKQVMKLRTAGEPVATTAWGAGTHQTSTWGVFHPQPYGEGWTFAPETHDGREKAR